MAFQRYVGWLLNDSLGSRASVIEERAYGKPEKLGPDWIVFQGDAAVLIECRTSSLTLESKETADLTWGSP